MKHYITGLIWISLLSFTSCKEEEPTDQSIVFQDRLNEMLLESSYDTKNKKKIIYWARSSCQGCRAVTVNTLMNNEMHDDIEVILPKGLENSEASYLDNRYKFIDNDNIFGQKYFGISNVGIIYLENDSIVEIRNYDANQMDEFEKEILKQ